MNPRFRAFAARERGFLSLSPDDGGRNGAFHRLGLRLFVNSPLARTGIVVKPAAFTSILTKPVPAVELTSPKDILPLVAAGEPDAMRQCIARHGGIVWTIVKRYLSDTTEAEDLVQEIFTEIWKKADAFNPAIAAESTFVGMIARRRAIDFLRRQGRQPGFETLDAIQSFSHNPWEGTSSVTCDPDVVKSSLANLPPETRELFQLFFESGFTHPEIAEKTGLPLGTIKTRLRRGLITLREQLQRIGNPNNQPAS